MCKVSSFYIDSFMSYRENRQTDGRTDIQDDRIKHSSGILNNPTKKDDTVSLLPIMEKVEL